MGRRGHSYLWSGLSAFVIFLIGLFISISSKDFSFLIPFGVVSVLTFTLVSCLILNNNFIWEMMEGIFEWSFVQLPGLIFTLDLEGIIWLLTVKLLFWILGIILAVICGILAIVIGLAMSLFVYPFAIYRSIHDENYRIKSRKKATPDYMKKENTAEVLTDKFCSNCGERLKTSICEMCGTRNSTD